MITNVIMPKAGMAMEQGTVVRWLKSEGEYVKSGEELLEIETDKVNMTIEAEAEGYLLKILHDVGDVVPVTQTIAYIGEKGDTLPQDNHAEAPSLSESHDVDYDIIVVGGGPAGYIAAIRSAQLGAKTALIEKDKLGGTCLNRGCIPTKTYLESAKLLDTLSHCNRMGVLVQKEAVWFDLKAALDNKNAVVKKLTNGVGALLKSYGIDVISGEGTVLPNKTVQVNGKTYSAKAVIYAGGSVPAKLSIPGADHSRVLDSTQLLDMQTIPERLVIIGGGVIGVELACAFNSFGSKVTVIEFMERLIPNMDRSLSEALEKRLKASGITIRTSTKCDSITEGPNGNLTVSTTGGSFEADYVLVAVGRKPDLDGIAKAGVAVEKGAVVTDERMQTSINGIYAPGDVNGRLMLAHAAFKMAEVAAENIMGMNSAFDAKNIPSCIYTFPEVASVGLSEDAARKVHKVVVGRFPFSANGRALAAGAGDGFIKVVADESTNELLGIHIIGPSATEMINEAAVLLHMEMDADEMAEIVHAHPTYSEALYEACLACIGRSAHSPKK